MDKRKRGNVLNRLTRTVQNQYLPTKIKERQMQDKGKDAEYDLERQKPKDFKSKLEFNGGVEEYLSMAKMANKHYEPLQEQVVLQNIHNDNIELKPSEYNKVLLENTVKNSDIQFQTDLNAIQIPRRPKWTPGVKPKEFEALENEAYLNWRRGLSEIELNSNLVITPYEKNIAVWRQLWLTIEKSQVLVQIVDARNPLFFRSEDLEGYIKNIDINKEYILLVNKADLLSEEIRISWADYFKSNGINFIFFSALWEDDNLADEDGNLKPVIEKKVESKEITKLLELYPKIEQKDYKIYNRDELIDLIKKLSDGKKKNHNAKSYMIGFIGYPNVGKSSIINVLMKKKKVGVAMMPGKTKHYQTLFLPNEPEICLMDCPGLVFPTFTHSKADLVVNGITPIDKIVDYLLPIQLVIYNVPRWNLEAYYKIKLPDLYSSTQFLQVIALKYGYLTGRSIPNEAMASRIILKDYVSGHLLYCYTRPDYSQEKHGEIDGYLYKAKNMEETLLKQTKENQEMLKQIPANFNDNYEMLGIDLVEKKVLKNYVDIDDNFFEDGQSNLKNLKIPKELKMQLKFCMKRGELSEEDYENIFTFEEAKNALDEIKNQKEVNKNNGIGNRKLIN